MKHYVLLDMSNILYKTFFVHKDVDSETAMGLATATALNSLNKYYRKLRPTKMFLCFDRKNWRVDYTKSDECLSGWLYKGKRRLDMSAEDRARYERFKGHIEEFEELMRNHTTLPCLAADSLEADDLIAGLTETLHDQAEITIVSSDKDFMQLLKYESVHLLDPASGKERDLRDYDFDADYFMFEKCVRGDVSDNVMKAFPRVRKTRIVKAYKDKFERANFMNETWESLSTDGEKVQYRVGDVFKENGLLMDLTMQPPHIKDRIDDCIVEELSSKKTYSHFHFLRFCGKYELRKVADRADDFAKMLSS